MDRIGVGGIDPRAPGVAILPLGRRYIGPESLPQW